MKMLHVIPTYSSHFGGPARVVKSLSKPLAQRHDVTVYTTSAIDNHIDFSQKTTYEIDDNVEVVYFPRIFQKSGFNFSPLMKKALKDNIGQYDVVHLHSWRHYQDYVVYHYAKKNNVPYVLQTHGSLPTFSQKAWIKHIYDYFIGSSVLKGSSHVIALSKIEANQYSVRGVPSNKIKVIPNGIDLSEFDNLPPRNSFRAKFNLSSRRNIILFLGRVHHQKGLDFLLDAFHTFKNKNEINRDLLVVAGPDDGYLEAMKAYVKSNKLEESVIFTGLLSEDDKRSLLVDASLTVYLNPNEPYGLVSLESAASGTPVVVINGTPMADIVNSGNFGYTIEYNDIGRLSHLFEKVSSCSQELVQLGENGRKNVFKNYGWNSLVTKYESVYDLICNE